MRVTARAGWVVAALAATTFRAGAQADASAHRVRRVAVDSGVRLEVLDWGGAGQPIVLLAGAARTAHDFDAFAPKLAMFYRVYGVTRRGLGMSSRPELGYESDRLGDDVLAVLDSLGLTGPNRPVLVGHSRAGAELSAVGARHPERVAGLVYLDAAYQYAYYDRVRGHPGLDMPEVQRKLQRLQFGPAMTRHEADSVVSELIDHDLPLVTGQLRASQQRWASVPDTASVQLPPPPAVGTVTQKLWAGAQRYTRLGAPVLALYSALGCQRDGAGPVAGVSWADDFRRHFPAARVVCLPNAEHYVWETNEADVVRELRAFIGTLAGPIRLPARPKANGRPSVAPTRAARAAG